MVKSHKLSKNISIYLILILNLIYVRLIDCGLSSNSYDRELKERNKVKYFSKTTIITYNTLVYTSDYPTTTMDRTSTIRTDYRKKIVPGRRLFISLYVRIYVFQEL